MRLNHGIRRRLAPLLENDRRRLELAYALLFSLPGSPVIYYGDEIGMGDDITLGDRDGVRTPMQWSSARHGGFSSADGLLVSPTIDDPVYGYRVINVESQERSDESLLARVKRLIRVRRRHPAFGRGTIEFLECGNRRALAFVRRHADETLIVVANLAASPQPVGIQLPSSAAGLTAIEIIDDVSFPAVGAAPYTMTLGPHACHWLQLAAVPTARRVPTLAPHA